MAPSLCEVRSDILLFITVWIAVHLFRIVTRGRNLALTGSAARRVLHMQRPNLCGRSSRSPKRKQVQEPQVVKEEDLLRKNRPNCVL